MTVEQSANLSCGMGAFLQGAQDFLCNPTIGQLLFVQIIQQSNSVRILGRAYNGQELMDKVDKRATYIVMGCPRRMAAGIEKGYPYAPNKQSFRIPTMSP